MLLLCSKHLYYINFLLFYSSYIFKKNLYSYEIYCILLDAIIITLYFLGVFIVGLSFLSEEVFGMGMLGILFNFSFIFGIFLFILILMGVKIIYERAVVLRLGGFNRILSPGFNIIIPFFDSMKKVDIRVFTEDVPDQDCITRDNVSIRVNAVLYYNIKNPEHAVLKVNNYHYATSQLAQTTMRDIIGEITLDQLLAGRDQVSKKLKEIIDEATDKWGIQVHNVEIKHIELPKNMVRTMAKAAEAAKEKEAVIIKAEGEVIAAKNMSKAADTLSASQGALHLRTLQTLNDLSSDQSNTIIIGIPLEILKGFEKGQ